MDVGAVVEGFGVGEVDGIGVGDAVTTRVTSLVDEGVTMLFCFFGEGRGDGFTVSNEYGNVLVVDDGVTPFVGTLTAGIQAVRPRINKDNISFFPTAIYCARALCLPDELTPGMMEQRVPEFDSNGNLAYGLVNVHPFHL